MDTISVRCYMAFPQKYMFFPSYL